MQVEQIMSLRSDMLATSEDLRRTELDKLQLEADISTLKQQVRGW
jgi:hypothetical protein